jgi:hypothetical protein
MMNFGSVGEKLLFVAAIVAFVMIFALMRGRDPRRARAEIVRTLASELRINTILVETWDLQPVQRSFEVTGWHLYRKKLQFLEKDLQKDTADVFGAAADYNLRLKTARKAKSTEKVTPDLEMMKTAIPRVKRGLEDWLLANVGSIDQQQRPGLIDGLFGGR